MKNIEEPEYTFFGDTVIAKACNVRQAIKCFKTKIVELKTYKRATKTKKGIYIFVTDKNNIAKIAKEPYKLLEGLGND